MNYNEIVGRFAQVVEDHKMLVDFGYGQISDIKTRSEGMGEAEGADYPYLFLNPGVHQREENMITYNFNMIIMDMAREEEGNQYQNFLNIQSDCIQYCDDVIARLYYHYKDQPEISFDVSYTPFYERFQDDLAGATAVIQIMVPNSINECIAPFEEPVDLFVLTNPAGKGNEPYVALSKSTDYVNFPQYTRQSDTLDIPFDTNGPYAAPRTAPEVQNEPGSTTQPYWSSLSRELTFPVGVDGIYKIKLDLDMINVQGLDLTDDTLRILFIGGGIDYRVDLPNLPVDGTPVRFFEEIEFTSDPRRTQEVQLIFQYRDDAQPPAPTGPIVGYTGDLDLVRIGDAPIPEEVLVLDVESSSDQLFKPDIGDSPQLYPVTILDTYAGMANSGNIYKMNGFAPAGLSNWTFTETGQAEKALGTEPFVDPRLLTVRLTDNSEYQVQPTTSTFPTNAPIGEVFNYTVTWEIEIDPSTVNYVAVQDKDDVATEPQYWTKAGVNLKGYTNA